MESRSLPGSLKIAILVRALDGNASRKILSSLSPEEKELVSQHISQMGPVSTELIEQVAREFAETIKNSRQRRPARVQIEGKASRAAADSRENNTSLKAILELEPDQIYNLIKGEHPQTIAIVLVHLESAVASEVLSLMPDDIKTDVSIRIANLDKVDSAMLDEINSVLEEILRTKGTSIIRLQGGVERLAELLNMADETSSEHIINELEEKNPELAAQIRQKMFVFEDLVLVDDRGFQKLLRRVETAELATALKAASEKVKEKVFSNMSLRAAEMLKEEISDMGPVRMKEVTDTQQKITAMIQEMEVKGELIISGRRGEQFVA